MRKYSNDENGLPNDPGSLGIFYEYSPTMMIEYLQNGYVRVYEFGIESVPLKRILKIADPFYNHPNKDTVYLSSSRPIRIPRIQEKIKQISILKKKKQLA